MRTPHAVAVFVLGCAIGLSGLPSPAAAQDAETPDWTVPRTEYGHPDIQGRWSNGFVTPLQRREGQEPTLTQEQVAQLEQGASNFLANSFEPLDPDRAAPEATTNPGAYDLFYVEPGERVAIVNGEPRSSIITRPENGRLPELTAEGKRRRTEQAAFGKQFGEHDHPELLPLPERCLVPVGPRTGPPMIGAAYNNNYYIVQTADHVAILTEQYRSARIIRLGDVLPLPDHIRPWHGDSRGRWEGDTLVVETTNIHPLQHDVQQSMFAHELDRRPGNQVSETVTVIERFTRVDENTLLYDFTVDDPVVYTEPWGGEIPMWRQNELMYEYACHEANYGMFNILRGARYQERQAAESARQEP